jgi:hypothetical protein
MNDCHESHRQQLSQEGELNVSSEWIVDIDQLDALPPDQQGELTEAQRKECGELEQVDDPAMVSLDRPQVLIVAAESPGGRTVPEAVRLSCDKEEDPVPSFRKMARHVPGHGHHATRGKVPGEDD